MLVTLSNVSHTDLIDFHLTPMVIWKKNILKTTFGEGLCVAPPSVPPCCVCVWVKMPQASRSRFRPQSLPDRQTLLRAAHRFPALVPSSSTTPSTSSRLHHAWILSSFLDLNKQVEVARCLLDSRTQLLVRGLSSLVPQTSHSSSPAMEPFAEVRWHWITFSPWNLPLFSL